MIDSVMGPGASDAESRVFAAYLKARLFAALGGLLLNVTIAMLNGWPRGPVVMVPLTVLSAHAILAVNRPPQSAAGVLGFDILVVAGVAAFSGAPLASISAVAMMWVLATVMTRGHQRVALGVWTLFAIPTAHVIGGVIVEDLPLIQQRRVEIAAVAFFGFATVSLINSLLRQMRLIETERAALAASKDEFIASVSHEIRTPLTGVIGLSAELRDNHASYSDAERAELQALIATQSSDVAAIVEDLLVVSRMESGQVRIVTETASIHDSVDEVVRSLQLGASFDVAAVSDVVVMADQRRLKQIIRNLVTNAMRYGGPEKSITVGSDRGWGTVAVTDNGAGIAADRREVMFAPYARGGSEPQVHGSIGLGLTVSKMLAELMGGTLTYDYVEGLSIFELRIPLVGSRTRVVDSLPTN